MKASCFVVHLRLVPPKPEKITYNLASDIAAVEFLANREKVIVLTDAISVFH